MLEGDPVGRAMSAALERAIADAERLRAALEKTIEGELPKGNMAIDTVIGGHSKNDDFRKALENLINCHSMENGSDTPDFMLAEYLSDCLRAFDKAVSARERWYDRACGGGAITAALGENADPTS